MQIKIKVPADAEVRFDANSRELVVEPLFTKSEGRAVWAYVSVCGEGGAVRRSTLQCSGKSGQTFVHSTAQNKVGTSFDKLPPASDESSRKKKSLSATPLS